MFSRLYSSAGLVAKMRRVSKSTKYLPLTRQKSFPSIQGCRHSSTSNRLSPEVGVGGQIQPFKENEDVTSLDRLVNVIRARSDPTHSSVVPMRSPLLWSETAFNENTKAKQIQIAPIPLPNPLPTRSMMDSYSELVLPFAAQKELLEQYINATGGLRIGKLMENLDSLAGSIAYKHVLGPGVYMESETIHERGFFIVTAAVDRLDMLLPLFRHNVRDLRLSGHIIHTGSSSMEVVVKMELLGGKEETVLLGRFSMVCRDAFTQKARPVPQLRISTSDEQALFNMGAAHKERRIAFALKSLDRVPPTTEEVEQSHRLYLDHGENAKCESHTKRVWMEDTCLENCILMFPQERNVHSKIFGGYLMRLAYELGITTATLFSHRSLRFLSLDSLSFRHPVQIGSILRLRSKVALTAVNERYPAIIHTTVGASVVDVKTGKELKTNDFRFTWCDDDGEPLALRVVPRTYQDSMEWIEAKRAVDKGDEIRRIRDHDHLETPLH